MADVLKVTIECEKIAEKILNEPILDGKSLKELTEDIKRFQWIPAIKELPECNERVLVCCDNDEIYTAHLRDDMKWYECYDEQHIKDYGKVIAWMPLPEPYKGEK